jgi:hypothetical protein
LRKHWCFSNVSKDIAGTWYGLQNTKKDSSVDEIEKKRKKVPLNRSAGAH